MRGKFGVNFRIVNSALMGQLWRSQGVLIHRQLEFRGCELAKGGGHPVGMIAASCREGFSP